MAQTVRSIIADVQETFTNANPDSILRCLNRVHRILCSEFPVYKETIVLTLVAGQQEYAISADVVQVRTATYLPDANGGYWILSGANVADMDRQWRGWRRLPNSTPRAFYLDAGFAGLVPAPDTSSASGYPRVELEALKVIELTMTDTLPAVFSQSDAHLDGTRAEYAKKEAPDTAGFWMGQFERQIQTLERRLGRRNSQWKPKASPESYSLTQF